jgi:hypothetical protein
MLVLVRLAAADVRLEATPTAVLAHTVPVRLIAGSVIDPEAGTATFDAGTSKFVVRVSIAAPHFSADLDASARADAADRGIDVEHARVETVERRIEITPKVIEQQPAEPVLIELAYIPWHRQATRIELYSSASGAERARWSRLARSIVTSTQVTPASSFHRFGPFVVAIPRRVVVLHHATFDELQDGISYCLVKSIDDPEGPVAPADAFGFEGDNIASDSKQKDWFAGDGIGVWTEITLPSHGLRIRCFAATKRELETLFTLLDTMRKPPRLEMLERIHGLLTR